MSAVEKIDSNLANVPTADLQTLAANEYRDGLVAMEGALGHFLRCGRVLLVARDRVPNGEWRRWCKGAGIHHTRSSRLMRLAYYWDDMPSEAMSMWTNEAGAWQQPSLIRALTFVSGRPHIRPKSDGPIQYSKALRDEAQRLRAGGATWRECSEIIGVADSTIRDWAEPERVKRRAIKRSLRGKEHAAARAALREKQKREERDALARTTGGDIERAYGLVRQLLARLSKVQAQSFDAEVHRQIERGYGQATRTEATIVAAMRAARQAPS